MGSYTRRASPIRSLTRPRSSSSASSAILNKRLNALFKALKEACDKERIAIELKLACGDERSGASDPEAELLKRSRRETHLRLRRRAPGQGIADAQLKDAMTDGELMTAPFIAQLDLEALFDKGRALRDETCAHNL